MSVPTAMFYRLVMYHFYVRGSFLMDTGLLASLTWHNGALLLPPSLGGGSFFASHVAPVLVLVSALSDLLPATLPQMFAGFVGLSHRLLALAMFWLLAGGQRGWPVLLATIAGIAFSAGGLAIAIARYPHFETFGAACLLLVCVALAKRRHVVAAVAFVFALTTREDVGLHAFAFLSLWAIAERLRGVPWRRTAWVVGFALTGLAWSVSELMAQRLTFPGQSAFARIYTGDPPYAHLTWALLGDRMLGGLTLHACILLPALAVALWAARTRDPFLLLGYVACLPWALLHLLAAGPIAGWMVAYTATRS